jgi:hypothetical protein
MRGCDQVTRTLAQAERLKIPSQRIERYGIPRSIVYIQRLDALHIVLQVSLRSPSLVDFLGQVLATHMKKHWRHSPFFKALVTNQL